MVEDLLSELGGSPPSDVEMGSVFDDLVSGGDAGFIVIGEQEGTATAVCSVSFLRALRSRGRYAIIQEMFVEPEARSSGVGMAILRYALEHAVLSACSLVELGTPNAGDRHIRFYKRAGFVEIGARLRWRA